MSSLPKILQTIKKVAALEKVKPSEVTKAMFFGHSHEITEWDLRKTGGLGGILKAHFPVEGKELADIKELGNAKKYVATLEKRVGEAELFERVLVEKLSKLVPISKSTYKFKKDSKTERILTLVLSDLHFGSDILATETGHLNYTKVEESRRLAKVVQETIEYKKQYRENTELELLLLGDIIQSQLHDMRDGAPLAEQVARAIHLLLQAIELLASNFKHVSVRTNSGNHGRNTARHHDRATLQKWDSIESMLYYALKVACANLKNVEFFIPLTPYVDYTVFGRKIYATHGDTVLNPGNPGKSLNIKGLENQVNKINASLKDNDEYAAFIVGHTHCGSMSFLANGSTMITNGALCPVDQYALSIGMSECQNGQWIFESVPGYPVGDTRFIRVDQNDDKNKELDKLIKPFAGF